MVLLLHTNNRDEPLLASLQPQDLVLLQVQALGMTTIILFSILLFL